MPQHEGAVSKGTPLHYSHSGKITCLDQIALYLQALAHFSFYNNSLPKVCMSFIINIMCITKLLKQLAAI